MRVRIYTFVVLLSLSFSAPALAQDATSSQTSQTRCEVTGPLVISAYAAFLDEVGGGDRSGVRRQAQSTSSLIQLYEKLGCSVPALQAAIECITSRLLAPDGSAARVTTGDAEACMRGAGMVVR